MLVVDISKPGGAQVGYNRRRLLRFFALRLEVLANGMEEKSRSVGARIEIRMATADAI